MILNKKNLENMEVDFHGFQSENWDGNQMLAHMSL